MAGIATHAHAAAKIPICNAFFIDFNRLKVCAGYTCEARRATICALHQIADAVGQPVVELGIHIEI